jgi:hypothetical protein
MRTPVALPPKGKENVMRRHSEPYTFDERLNAEKARIEAALESTEPSLERDLLERKFRQIETALHIDGWLSSTGQPPKSLG